MGTRSDRKARQRIADITRRLRMDPVLAGPTVEAIVQVEGQLAAAASGGDAKAVDALSLSLKRLQETVGLGFSQRPPEGDVNALAWLQALARAAAAERFSRAHRREEDEVQALLQKALVEGDGDARERLEISSRALRDAFNFQMPGLFKAEALRLAGERGIEAPPDLPVWPDRWTLRDA